MSAGTDSTTARFKLHCRAVNELTWVTLQVPDVEQSRRFWRDVMGLPEIVAVTMALNLRSRAVMGRIGMTSDPAEDFDDPDVDEVGPLHTDPGVGWPVARPSDPSGDP